MAARFREGVVWIRGIWKTLVERLLGVRVVNVFLGDDGLPVTYYTDVVSLASHFLFRGSFVNWVCGTLMRGKFIK